MGIVALLRTIKRTNSSPTMFHRLSAIMLRTLKVDPPPNVLFKTVNKSQVIWINDQRSILTAKCTLNPGAQDEKNNLHNLHVKQLDQYSNCFGLKQNYKPWFKGTAILQEVIQLYLVPNKSGYLINSSQMLC